jgi:uncharacterized iron-regulated protein
MIISKSTLYVGFFGAVLLVVGADFNLASAQSKSTNKEGTDCVPVASWVVPAGKKITNNEVIGRAAKQSVVLLGEMHDNLEHHRWQLQMLAALYASRPDMVIGFEMFPRRVQKALDRWVAGDFSEAEFLAAADWDSVWSTDASYYLPLFHFARMNRIPMVALNVDTRLRREISAKSFDGVPESEREGVTRPASPSVAYQILGGLLRASSYGTERWRKRYIDRSRGRAVRWWLGSWARDILSMAMGFLTNSKISRS